jgi:hypothetical protein
VEVIDDRMVLFFHLDILLCCQCANTIQQQVLEDKVDVLVLDSHLSLLKP